MKNKALAQKLLLIIGVLILLTPLVYFKWSLYPISFPKSVYFQFLVSLALLVAVPTWVRHHDTRPKKSWLLGALVTFFVVQVVAALQGVYVVQSFFSDMVRSTGLFFQLHVLALVVVYSSGILNKKQWRVLFTSGWIVSVLVAVMGIVQLYFPSVFPNFASDRISSSLGNPLFLATYAVLHIWITPILWKWYEAVWSRVVLTLGVIVLLSALWFTFARGSLLGMAVGIGTFVAVLVASRSRFWKRLVLLGVVFSVIAASLFVVYRNSDFVQNSSLSRFTGTRSLQTRAVNWSMAWNGFVDRPLFGWGPENYRQLVDKHFDRRLSELSYLETYADKPHNLFLELLATSGAFGAVAYLLVVGGLIVVIRRLRKAELMSTAEFAAWCALGSAHAVQMLFLFETTASYLSLGIFVAYLLYRYSELLPEHTESSKKVSGQVRLGVTGVLILGMGVLVYWFSYLPLKSAVLTNTGLQYTYVDDWIGSRSYFFDAFETYTPYAFERWRWTADAAAAVVYTLETQSFNELDAKTQQFWKEDIETISQIGEDMLLKMPHYLPTSFIGKFYYQTGVGTKDIARFDRAEELFVAAQALSANREEADLLRVQVHIFRNEIDEALAILEPLVERAPNVNLVRWYNSYTLLQKPDLQREGLDEALFAMSLGFQFENDQQREALAQRFVQEEYYDGLVTMYEHVVKSNKLTHWYARLAAAYAQVGRIEDARDAVDKAVKYNPEFAAEAASFLRGLEKILEQGKSPLTFE